jgi:GNAT superfamily N-acetyltransferase
MIRVPAVTDMLVKLYDLPQDLPPLPAGITVRRALATEQHQIVTWVSQVFSQGWAEEAAVAFDRRPVACWVALANQSPAGFCVYDATARGMLGPIGVAEHCQRQGVGRHLVVKSLQDMADQGYAYAVVGWAGPDVFFSHTVGAMPIPDSSPGMYRDRMPLLNTSS